MHVSTLQLLITSSIIWHDMENRRMFGKISPVAYTAVVVSILSIDVTLQPKSAVETNQIRKSKLKMYKPLLSL